MTQFLSVSKIAEMAFRERPNFNVPWRPALMRYAEGYREAASDTAFVDPCMLAAIVARETGGQNVYQFGVPAGPGCGVGICQITSGVDWSVLSSPSFPGYGPLMNPDVNLQVSAKEFLDPLLRSFPGSHLSAFAAYNLGAKAVKQELRLGLSPDSWTTHHDYGTDVFTSWITFAAVSLGYNVDWANHKPTAPPAPPRRGPLASHVPHPFSRDPSSDLTND